MVCTDITEMSSKERAHLFYKRISALQDRAYKLIRADKYVGYLTECMAAFRSWQRDNGYIGRYCHFDVTALIAECDEADNKKREAAWAAKKNDEEKTYW